KSESFHDLHHVVVGGVVRIIPESGITGVGNCEVAFNINQAVKSVLN
ncbi:hypothetical protein FOCG_17871, partial [Fusarium oxysporum f. sp. radicis-lycopersici 26381]